MRRVDLVRAALLPVCAAVLITCSSSEDDKHGPTAGTGGGGHGGTSGTGGGGTGATDAGPDSGNACLPETPDSGAVDQCPDGKYCTDARECVQGCKADGTACASANCDVNHDCVHCLSDSECSAGKLCSTGTCLPPCGDGGVACPTGYECCSGRCADTKIDFAYCSSCSNACSGEQFCNATSCGTAAIATVCNAPKVTFLLGGGTLDDAITPSVRDAFGTNCSAPPQTSIVNESESGLINPNTGQPVSGTGSLTVMVGGTYFQMLSHYLEDHGLTRVYNKFDNTNASFYTRGGDGGADTLVAQEAQSAMNASHGYFLIESVVDPTSHAWVLEIYGLNAETTRAGAWFFSNRIINHPGDFGGHYYIYKWTDSGAASDAGSPMPSEDDTFTLITSG